MSALCGVKWTAIAATAMRGMLRVNMWPTAPRRRLGILLSLRSPSPARRRTRANPAPSTRGGTEEAFVRYLTAMLIRCTPCLPSCLPAFLPSFLPSFLTSAPVASPRRNKALSTGTGLAHSLRQRTGVCDMNSLFKPRVGCMCS